MLCLYDSEQSMMICLAISTEYNTGVW